MRHIVDKVQKLLAVAGSTANEEEAAAFAAKAAALLAANNLSMADLPEEPDDALIEQEWQTMYLDPWRRRIIREAAKLYFCDIFLRKWYDKERGQVRDGVVLVGRPHNIYITKMMSEYLINTTMRLAIQYSHEHPSQRTTRRATRLAFERGCGEMLAHRLYKIREESTSGEKVMSGSNPGNLPALYEVEGGLSAAYVKSLGLKNAKVRGSDIDTVHSRAGITAANAISLSTQIEPGEKTQLLESRSA